MAPTWLSNLLDRIRTARVAILGELCLDCYWFYSEDTGDLSIETGLSVNHVRRQQYSLGGAANVAANLYALGVKEISVIGVVGQDPFGRMLFQLLDDIGVDSGGVVRDQADWQTCVYAKPFRGGAELSRLDFGSFNTPSKSTRQQLTASIHCAADYCDILIVNQQILRGVIQTELIEAVNQLAYERPAFQIIVDSRHFASNFRNVSLKINVSEAAHLISDDGQTSTDTASDVRLLAHSAYEKMNRHVFITDGERGIVVASRHGVEKVPAVQVPPPIDIVGAGDTALSSIAAVMAVERSDEAPLYAARLANIAASVTVQKLNTTGTASPAEILAAVSDN